MRLMSQPVDDDAPRGPRPKPAEPVDPSRMLGPDGVQERQGVRSPDYGEGTIVGLSANGVTIYWKAALEGTRTHLLEHDRSYVERLERLP